MTRAMLTRSKVSQTVLIYPNAFPILEGCFRSTCLASKRNNAYEAALGGRRPKTPTHEIAGARRGGARLKLSYGMEVAAHLRWFWSITVYVDPKRGVVTFGRGSTIEEAKLAFLSNWERVRL